AAAPTLSLHRLDLGASSWTAEGDLTAPHRCCALAADGARAPETSVLCLGHCGTLKSEVQELREKIDALDRSVDLAKLVSSAEYEAAASRPTSIRAEMHLLSALFGGEDPV